MDGCGGRLERLGNGCLRAAAELVEQSVAQPGMLRDGRWIANRGGYR